MNRGWLYYLMIPLLAVGALFQSAAGNRLAVVGVKPDVVLMLIVVGTLLYGGRIGVFWAFIGGLFLDIFSGGPLGSSSLALMAAGLVAALGHSTFSRFNPIVPLTSMALGTLVYGVVYLAVLYVFSGVADVLNLEAIRHQLPFEATVQAVIVPSIAYNTTLMLILVPFLNRIPETPETVAALQ